MALGIDIYRSFQTVTNWQSVKNAGVTYVYVKLSDGGGTPVGGRGDNEVNGAKSVGIPVGGYHFVQANPSPEAQADILLGEVTRLDATGCVPMLDLEDNPAGSSLPNIPDSQKTAFAVRFLNRVAAAGFRPGVYLNNALAKTLRPDQWGIPNLVIWIARYGALPDAAAGRYDLHQYSSSGSIAGITANGIDLDESYTDAYLGALKPVAPPEQEDDMPERELEPTSGQAACKTLVVPKTATELVVSQGWVPLSVIKLAFFGPTPATGLNQLSVPVGGGAPFTVAAARSWEVPIPAGAVTAELTYTMTADTAHATTGVVGFR